MFALAVAIIVAAAAVRRSLPEMQTPGGTIGAAVAGTFLWVIGIMNLLVLVNILQVWRQAKLAIHSHAQPEELLTQRGLFNRLWGGRLQIFISCSWHMYPLGLLFGLGFDTASEIGLLALTAAAVTGDLPVAAVLSLPILFATGMSAMDTTDGVLMTKAYSWTFVHPLRNIFYNITITTLSIAVALLIGNIELLQVSIDGLHLNGRFFDIIRGLDFGIRGYVVVGMFVLAWDASVALWRFGQIEERYRSAVVHTNEHTHYRIQPLPLARRWLTARVNPQVHYPFRTSGFPEQRCAQQGPGCARARALRGRRAANPLSRCAAVDRLRVHRACAGRQTRYSI